ncbi:hypothetical protein [Ktedonospora formicarum]|nr:hypothetical protein [Ktedonospora formicarum]
MTRWYSLTLGMLHAQSLEINSCLSLSDARPSYNQAIERFPIR